MQTTPMEPFPPVLGRVNTARNRSSSKRLFATSFGVVGRVLCAPRLFFSFPIRLDSDISDRRDVATGGRRQIGRAEPHAAAHARFCVRVTVGTRSFVAWGSDFPFWRDAFWPFFPRHGARRCSSAACCCVSAGMGKFLRIMQSLDVTRIALFGLHRFMGLGARRIEWRADIARL